MQKHKKAQREVLKHTKKERDYTVDQYNESEFL